MSKQTPSYLGTSRTDYERFGVKKDEIEQWEDGFRTDGSKGTYEWWYFDAHLDDTSKIVIVFYTKSLVDVGKPLAPYVSITLDRPDGTHVEKMYYAPATAFTASKEKCDVRLGPNIFEGDLHTCRIHLEIEDVLVNLTLTGTVPPWRPATGSIFFGGKSEHYFAWLPAVPQGDVDATITIDSKTEKFTGIGYHDHNWGNISMVRLMNHWYWARGKVGAYTVIASHITAEKPYAYKTFPIFMLAREGKILVDDGSKVTFSDGDVHTDKETGKPVANLIVYEYKDETDRYLLTFKREKTILRLKLVDDIHGIQGFLARLIGFDGAFLRFTGDLAIDHYSGDKLVESEHEEAIWELMYFGHVQKN
ncbi:MAG TPA: hydroxyneurosporene dehydrogenase [Chloroflexia bacterium]|nr:hydroxyneurosporene dehydrogenase [Chloroflexia bacterium]